MAHENGQRPESDELLTVREWRADDAAIVAAVGEVDMLTVPRLRAAVFACLAEPSVSKLVLDLSGLTFLGSIGLTLIVDTADEADRVDQALRVVVGEQHGILRVFEVTGLDKQLPLCRTVEQALAAD